MLLRKPHDRLNANIGWTSNPSTKRIKTAVAQYENDASAGQRIASLPRQSAPRAEWERARSGHRLAVRGTAAGLSIWPVGRLRWIRLADDALARFILDRRSPASRRGLLQGADPRLQAGDAGFGFGRCLHVGRGSAAQAQTASRSACKYSAEQQSARWPQAPFGTNRDVFVHKSVPDADCRNEGAGF